MPKILLRESNPTARVTRTAWVATGTILAAAATTLADNPPASGWTGGYNNNWSNAGNWDNNNPPQSNGSGGPRDLYFGQSYVNAKSGRTTSNNDLTNYAGHQIIFDPTNATPSPAFTLTGNAITLYEYGGANPFNPRINNQSSALQTLNFDVTFNSGSANDGEVDATGGDLTFGGAVTLAGATQLNINSGNGHMITFNGAINGSASNKFSLNGNNVVLFNAANSYSGDTYVNAGVLRFNAAPASSDSAIRLGDTSGSAAAELDVSASGGLTLGNLINSRAGSSGALTVASLNASGTNTLSGLIVLDHDLTITQAAGSGALNLTSVRQGTSDTSHGLDTKGNTLTLSPGTGGSVAVYGTIYNSTGSGNVTAAGTGNVLFYSANTYGGTTTINANATLTLTSAGTLGGGAVTDNGQLVVANSATVANAIGGSGSLTATGSVNPTLTNANSYTGGTTIASGASLTLGSNGNSGTSGTLGSGDIADNGTLIVQAANTFSQKITGAGALSVSGGKLVTLAGANTFSGGTTVEAGSSLYLNNGGTLGTRGVTLADSSVLAFNNSNTNTVANVIGGSGRVFQLDSGTTVLTGANTYTLGTTINGGTLRADAVRTPTSGTLTSSATGLGSVSVTMDASQGTRGTLAGNGGTGDVTVASGGTITAGTGATPSDSVGTLTTGNETWQQGGRYTVKFANNQPTAAQNWDHLSMTGLSLSGLDKDHQFLLTVIKSAGGVFTSGTAANYIIATVQATGNAITNGSTAYQPGDNITSLFALDTSGIAIDASRFSVTVGQSAGAAGETLLLDYDGGTTAAPEPTTAALLGLGAMSVLGRRRRGV